MIEIDQESCRNLETALSREWLETNGIGGFSSSTITGLNTRRYHGLLTAATKPPVGRLVLLSKLEETLIIDGRRYELSANQYPGAVHPEGFKYQTGFRLDPFPVFTYEVEGMRLEKRVFMVQGENTTVVQYEVSVPPEGRTAVPIVLKVRPLIAFRDYHSTTHENGALNSNVETQDGLTTIKPYSDLPALYFAHDTAQIDVNGFWYRNFQYAVEQERGLDFAEDLFSPCAFTFDLNASAKISIIASTERCAVANADAYGKAEIERKNSLGGKLPTDQLPGTLAAATDQFIVARERCKTVIAGYHWFADWGRDTMIALPGLTLATGHAEIAKSILAEFAAHVDQGMLPNRFPDAGETPEYNTVDATLWFFEAVRSLLQYTNDFEFVRANLYAVLTDIIDWHVRGTRYQIHVDKDGLLYSGEPGVQLTWMDAKVGDWVVTPRHGKPVEIQALWYNALRVMEQLAAKFEDAKSKKKYAAMADKARSSFNKIFWNEEAGCLYDLVNGDDRDASIRPNQVFATSLANSMVSTARAKNILRIVERELLTPRGLRTLSPNDSRYIGRYEGDSRSRDGSYHQGTVWPWLMGSYITAYSKTFGERAGHKFATEWLKNFHDHLREACLGQVSEIFDGDHPHTPRGCVAQAWSVAELLRAALENVYPANARQSQRPCLAWAPF
ncbi:MAG TPA: amylo-alpha-1,6-glucosidase [Pyrinomonadaceae bacterium]|nr:amylo-alpha-1,6-glucosidase [Pyrinomonadaceae bacterium]